MRNEEFNFGLLGHNIQSVDCLATVSESQSDDCIANE